jgi:hypothetical protein
VTGGPAEQHWLPAGVLPQGCARTPSRTPAGRESSRRERICLAEKRARRDAEETVMCVTFFEVRFKAYTGTDYGVVLGVTDYWFRLEVRQVCSGDPYAEPSSSHNPPPPSPPPTRPLQLQHRGSN